MHLFLGDKTGITLTVGSNGKVWAARTTGNLKTNGDFPKLLKEFGE